ncbi:hypothetical protein [Marinobacterium sp. BA1]|uniref:hypothetical protein n=1 Tax=Marinobacterium sp. BA1 TaxID=3138931 RepID=UPI0032E6E199
MDAQTVFTFILLFAGPLLALTAGWALFTLAFCARALIKRQPVGPVLREMLEEW